MKITKHTWKFVGLLLFGTAAVLWVGCDLLDGEAEIRGRRISLTSAPGRYWYHVIMTAIAALMVIGGWIAAYATVHEDANLYRWRPPIDEPSHRGHP